MERTITIKVIDNPDEVIIKVDIAGRMNKFETIGYLTHVLEEIKQDLSNNKRQVIEDLKTN